MNTLEKYNKQVPRYTSYPTAPHFTSDVSSDTYADWLKHLPKDEPISLYLHMPFCKQLCWYCGCHTKITQNQARIHEYVASLLQEIKLVRHYVSFSPKVSHIHWGGGTPHYMSEKDFSLIMSCIYKHFDVQKNAEIAVECDPRILSEKMVDAFVLQGVNRVSFGVQDFNENVQNAINRKQPFSLVKEKVELVKEKGIRAVNFDLIYGLPFQKVETIKETVELTAKLCPDRVAVFGYAHVPWLKKHQKVIEKYALPTAKERRELENMTRSLLLENGYEAVGLDHFARPEDSMAKAVKTGDLKRNFQGYTTDTADYLIGFGASAISCVPNGYAQNNTDIQAYENAIAQGDFATVRGVQTSLEDCRRRQMIMEIMGNYALDFSKYTDIDYTEALDALDQMKGDKLIQIQNNQLIITSKGRPYVRTIASVFDTYLNPIDQKHSQAV